jgi:3-phenylpropionate/trans-cinnamate dioxygenase ferredoxin subunit
VYQDHGDPAMTYTKVLSTKDLPPGKMKSVEAGGKQILLVNLDGKYYAFGDICTHMTCKLSEGSIKGNSVTCPCHFSVFDVKTGKVLSGPASKPEPIFKVKVEREQILVDL